MNIKRVLIAGIVLAIGIYGGYLWQAKPKVSVVMLTYQRETMLPQAIESILGQTYKNFELIIINDGSTDQTGEILKNYKQDLYPILVFETVKTDSSHIWSPTKTIIVVVMP